MRKATPSKLWSRVILTKHHENALETNSLITILWDIKSADDLICTPPGN